MEIQESRTTFQDWANKHSTFYVKEPQCKIHEYQGSIHITLLENAMIKGKTCPSFTINWDSHSNECFLLNWLQERFNYSLVALIDYLKGLELVEGYKGKIYLTENLEVTLYDRESYRTFSPFSNGSYNPLKEVPKKWSLTYAIRAILNGQFKALKCDSQYTDDYAGDAACNFMKGEIQEAKSFIKGIIESPSGWRSYVSERGEVILNCHHFNNNSFTLNIG